MKKLVEAFGFNFINGKVVIDDNTVIDVKDNMMYTTDFGKTSLTKLADVLLFASMPDVIKEELVLATLNNFPKNKTFDLKGIDSQDLTFIPREYAETSNELVHLIPYLALTNPKGEILIYERKGSEKRLHGQKSIGWGGHVDFADAYESTITGPINLQDTIHTALKRELFEELGITTDNMIIEKLYAYYSDKTPVDNVHLCIAYRGILLEGKVSDGEWKVIDDINIDELEHWSKILLKHIRKEIDNGDN